MSERQLLRRFRVAAGYGPKTLARVLRFARFVGGTDRGRSDIARLALDFGYADQAHLDPGDDQARRASAGGASRAPRTIPELTSVSFKTRRAQAATIAAMGTRERIDLAAAAGFIATHARVLDRRRFELQNSDGDTGAVLAALSAYRNPDGGYGWGLEPDLRSPESQPGAAWHAFEAFGDAIPAIAPEAGALRTGWSR